MRLGYDFTSVLVFVSVSRPSEQLVCRHSSFFTVAVLGAAVRRFLSALLLLRFVFVFLLFLLLQKQILTRQTTKTEQRVTCIFLFPHLLVFLVLVLLLVLVFLLFAPLAVFLLLTGGAAGGDASSH